MTDKGEAHVQYTVFVRNSDWAEPYVKYVFFAHL